MEINLAGYTSLQPLPSFREVDYPQFTECDGLHLPLRPGLENRKQTLSRKRGKE
jgi:hypothetical protein